MQWPVVGNPLGTRLVLFFAADHLVRDGFEEFVDAV